MNSIHVISYNYSILNLTKYMKRYTKELKYFITIKIIIKNYFIIIKMIHKLNKNDFHSHENVHKSCKTSLNLPTFNRKIFITHAKHQ